ncbi:MAG TPA: FHA domain-containing protein [Nocardioides sp.]|nr:FHA domain-containing protein [Nocardioides sp.]
MQSLLIEVDGRALRFDAPRLLRIGRSIEADVVLAAGSVSRQHAELRPVETGWVLVDSGSQYGTYVDGRRVTEHMISGPVTVQCGPPAAGSTLRITPDPVASAPAPAPVQAPMPVPVPASPSGPIPSAPPSPTDRPQGQTPPGGGYDETFVLAAQPPGPPGMGPPRSGPDLLVVAEGREFRFRHPAHLTIGRRPESDVVVTDPVCSRMHGQVTATPGGWTYLNSSQEGTFLNGRRVEQFPFNESVRFRLGHPVAGPELALVPILSAAEEERRFARKRRNRTLVRVGAGVAALILIGGTITAAVLLSGSDDDDPSGGGSGGDSGSSSDTMEVLTDEELDTAKAATVRLSAETTDLSGAPVEYSGSGSIIDEQGLILTNAHVAAPQAEGLAEQYGEEDQINDPEYLLVALTQGGDDRPADPEYRARVVEADGHLDAAVIEIYADEDGNELDDELDLPTLPIGDSDEVRTGDDVTVLGFPGISQSGAVTVTKGVVSTFIPSEEYGPRSEIDTDTRIAPGNSGGSAINNDAEIIGIPSAFFSEGTPIVSGRIRPINLVTDLISSAGG